MSEKPILFSIEVKPLVSRRVGRIMDILELVGVSEGVKRMVKEELWGLHDDILQIPLPMDEVEGVRDV